MKILHVLASSLGGGAAHVFDLIAHGASALEQRLVVPPDGGTIARRLSELGHEVKEIDMAKGWKWRVLGSLIKYIREYQPDVVHCHGFRAGLYGRLAARFASRKVKTVLTVHGFHFYYIQNPFKKQLLLSLERALKPLTHSVIAVSRTDARHLSQCGLISKERSRVIINGIPPLLPQISDKQKVRSRLNLLDRERPMIATAARLHYQKGVAYFLEAIPQILHLYPNAIFLILGEGPERAKLMRMAQDLHILSSVRFLGNRDDVIDILQIVDVFVLASLWEGLPLSLLEAMRAEVPIVATDVDGNRDVIEDKVSGFLVPPKNGEALARAIIQLLQNPILAEDFIEKAKMRLIDEFSVAKMLEETRQIYKEVVK